MEQCHWLTGETVLSAFTHSTPPCPLSFKSGRRGVKSYDKERQKKEKDMFQAQYKCNDTRTAWTWSWKETVTKKRVLFSPILFVPTPFLGKPKTKDQQGSYLFNYLSCLWLIIRCDNSTFVMLFTCCRWLTAPLLNSKANSCCHERLATSPVMDEYKRWMATINHHVCLGSIETWE